MAQQLADTLTTREAVRKAALEDLVTRAEIEATTMEGGPLDGISVISLGTLREQVTAALRVDLPPASERYAELLGPGEVDVTVPCPECGVLVTSTLAIHQQLVVESGVRKIKLKGKAEAIVHMHGQLPLPTSGQQGIDEAIGEIDDLRLRILRVVADVADLWGDGQALDETDPAPPPTLDTIARVLGYVTESDRADLEDALYGYAGLEVPLVEIVSVKGHPPDYILTEAGIEFVNAEPDGDQDGAD